MNKKNNILVDRTVSLKKVCEWIKEHDMVKHIGTLYSGVCFIRFDCNGFIDDLCNAMEE